jgi:hypothetical protein
MLLVIHRVDLGLMLWLKRPTADYHISIELVDVHAKECAVVESSIRLLEHFWPLSLCQASRSSCECRGSNHVRGVHHYRHWLGAKNGLKDTVCCLNFQLSESRINISCCWDNCDLGICSHGIDNRSWISDSHHVIVHGCAVIEICITIKEFVSLPHSLTLEHVIFWVDLILIFDLRTTYDCCQNGEVWAQRRL